MPGRVEPASDAKRTLGDAEQLATECAALETELTELKAAYEQYFLGVERMPPTKRHDALHKRVLGLKGQFIRQTAVKFRIQTLSSRLTTYERLWERTKLEIEAGTYRRDLFRAKRHQRDRQAKPGAAAGKALEAAHPDEDLDLTDLDEAPAAAAAPVAVPPVSAPPRPAVPPVAPVRASPAATSPAAAGPRPPTPVPPVAPVGPPRVPAVTPVGTRPPAVPAALPRPVITPPFGPVPARPATGAPPPVSASGGLTDQKIKAIYEAYVMAKKRCGEDTRSLTLDSVASSLKKQVPELMKQHKARSVEFKVVIKDGRAVLRALPKES